MFEILLKALSFILVITLAYTAKRKGFFSQDASVTVTKIALNITLPMAIITSFSTFEKDNTLFMLAVIGFIQALFMWFIGYIFSLKKQKNERIHYMMNLPCFNIGSFAMPFVQGFLGSYGVVATCMYDIGNAIVSSGTSYALTSSVINPTKDKAKQTKAIIKKLCSSVPFVTYTFMLVLAVLGISIPKSVVSLSSTAASANGFMAMFMLGLMLDLNIEKQYIKKVIQVLIIRYSICALFAFIFYFMIPFPVVIRQVLVLIMFSPTSALAPPFTKMCGGDETLSGFSSSLSIIISVIIMTILITFIID